MTDKKTSPTHRAWAWWHERVVYQIYPRSFKDTNGDGVGDLQGVIQELENLKDLGIGIIWLSPVYTSPNKDNGYDISNYCDINPEYGTMAEMEELIEKAKKLDIKLVMDLVINHTSTEHPWFLKSRKKEQPYTDYYIWKPAKKDGSLPNNWTSFFAEDCWEFDAERGEYYLHLFAKEQADLNYQNPLVLDEVKKIMRFWLDKGIAGFRCDVINILYKSSLEDGKKKLVLTGSEHYISQEGMHEILKELRRDVLDWYDCFTVGETVFVTPKMGKDLCDRKRRELNMIFSFEHMETDQYFVKWFKRSFNAARFAKTIAKWQHALEWNAIYLENHDQIRSVSRFGDDKNFWQESAKMLATMLFTLRGTPYVFQGQEIGMTNFDFDGMEKVMDVESKNVYELAKKLHFPEWYRWKIIQKSSRDNCRTPVQWNGEKNAGFTTGKPWISVNSSYKKINMGLQLNDPNSIRSFYKKMIKLRAESDVLKFGTFKELLITNNVFAYEREYSGEKLIVVLNFSGKPQKTPFKGEVVLSNYDKVNFYERLLPYEGVILK